MRALVLSTSASKDYFNKLLNDGYTPNPSNQHFYQLFIKMLSLNYSVDVLSYRPLTKQEIKKYKYEREQSDNITYHYLPFWNIKGLKSLCITNTPYKIIKPIISNDTIIFVDSLNISLIKLALKISKKFHVPIVGIVTDHPKNLSSVSTKYIKSVLKYSSSFDLYYCLTNSLNESFNIYKRPSLIIHGLLDPVSMNDEQCGFKNYFFFGGALYKRYGIENLLKAFHKWNKKYDLLIAGQGPETDLVRQYALKDEHIHYLGLIPVEQTLFYERNALLNINPRPFNQSLDSLSVPSKTLEYVNSGTLMMTTENSHLRKILGDSVMWIGNGEVKDIYNGFVDFEEMNQEEKIKKAREARAKVNNLYSLKVVSAQLHRFLSSNISLSNCLTRDSKVK